MIDHDILVANGFVAISGKGEPSLDTTNVDLATVVSNLAHYGYVLNRAAFDALASLPHDEIVALWENLKPIFAELTKENREIDKHVVFKNFPREVLQMEDAEYALRQMLVYNGYPYEAVAEEAEPRAPLGDLKRLKVLTLADENTPARIYSNLASLNNRWSDNQIVWATKLVGQRNLIDLDDFGFKENGIALIAKNFDSKEMRISTGTDVLRLAAALSDGDISLREKVKLRSFKRPERRKLLAMLDESDNLAEDMAARPEQFKRLLERLRPGDYKFENVKAAYDGLYNKMVKPFSAMVDPQDIVPETLDTLVQRPGEFLRRFHHFYDLFGDVAVERFLPLMDKLTSRQLVNFRAYLQTINDREMMIYPPKANWSRAQIAPNKKGKIALSAFLPLNARIAEILSVRLGEMFPEGIALDDATRQIKLQTNDQKLAEYGRGTAFNIPEEVTFIRSASYWQNTNHCWYDNGWNFFDENWKSVGVLSWSSPKFGDAAAFSGDPMNSGNTLGAATQVIDIYLDALAKKGVRYAVWNVLCYSKIKFSDATGEVLALLQWGENATKGQLFEPSRAQMTFPLKAEAFASYVAYVDVVERKLVYMDAPLKANVSNAESNSETLSTVMPAYVEYLKSLPSVHDLLRDAPVGTMPVLYSDREVAVEHERAFVFRPENAENEFERIAIADLVGA